MGGVQCGNGLVRIGAAFADLDGSSLEHWDSNQRYAIVMLIVDGISVAANVGSLPYNVRNLWAVVSRLRSFKTANLSFETLRGMNRLERMRAISRVFQGATRTDDGLEAIVVAAKEAQIGAKSMTRPSGLSVKHADTLVKIIHDETVARLESSLLNVFGNVAGPATSATPGSVTGSASGSVNYVIHLLDAGRPNL
jgi:hypothetical protein